MPMSVSTCRLLYCLAFIIISLSVVVVLVSAATITVFHLDGPGEGFNDPTPVVSVGGNPGVTLGEQRRRALQFAANIWGHLLVSDVEIRAEARFNPLGGDSNRATLAGAGPISVFRDFPNAPMPQTWYVAALANALAGIDLNPLSNDIGVTINSDLDGDVVLGNTRFYYGFDRSPPNADIDFVTVLLHELGHGLGFITFSNLLTGARLLDFDDAYLLNLIQSGVNPSALSAMTNAQRLMALQSGPNLLWNGSNVVEASSRLAMGRGGPMGEVEIFAPNPIQLGSSVSHFGATLAPDELMEPFFTVPMQNVGLTLELFQDLGWQTANVLDGSLQCAAVSGGDTSLGQSVCADDLPDNNEITGGFNWLGDVYVFTASAGEVVTLAVDAIEATLDPMLLLISPSNQILVTADNEVPCSVTLECGFSCPRAMVALPETGTYRVIIFDSDVAPETGPACTGGRYTVTMDGTGGVLLTEDDAGTGFARDLTSDFARMLGPESMAK